MKPDAPVKVAILITLPELGGAQSHVAQLLEDLDRDRFEPVLLTAGEGWLTEKARGLGVRVIPLRFLKRPISPIADMLAILEISRVLQRERPKVLHLHSSKAGLLGRLAGKLTGVPQILFTAHGFSFHAQLHPIAMRVFAFLERTLAPLADVIVPVSDYDRQRALQFRVCEPERLHCVPNGISPSRFEGHDRAGMRAALGMPEETVLVGMVARFAHPKDHEGLLEAMRPLLSDSDAVRLVLIGGGPEMPRIRRLAETLGVAGQVVFLGDRDDIPQLLAALDLFVLTSKFEGLPISVLEAMAAGLPVIASEVGGVPELVTHGETGMCVPAEDVEALREALCSLIADPAARERLGRKGRERARTEFTATKTVRGIEALYKGP